MFCLIIKKNLKQYFIFYILKILLYNKMYKVNDFIFYSSQI